MEDDLRYNCCISGSWRCYRRRRRDKETTKSFYQDKGKSRHVMTEKIPLTCVSASFQIGIDSRRREMFFLFLVEGNILLFHKPKPHLPSEVGSFASIGIEARYFSAGHNLTGSFKRYQLSLYFSQACLKSSSDWPFNVGSHRGSAG